MFDEKSFKFERTTLKKGLERLLPNLNGERRGKALAIVGYTFKEYMTQIKPEASEEFYQKLDEYFLNTPNEIDNEENISLGKEIYNTLLNDMKNYEMSLLKYDKRKVSRYRRKEIEFLMRLK